MYIQLYSPLSRLRFESINTDRFLANKNYKALCIKIKQIMKNNQMKNNQMKNNQMKSNQMKIFTRVPMTIGIDDN